MFERFKNSKKPCQADQGTKRIRESSKQLKKVLDDLIDSEKEDLTDWLNWDKQEPEQMLED